MPAQWQTGTRCALSSANSGPYSGPNSLGWMSRCAWPCQHAGGRPLDALSGMSWLMSAGSARVYTDQRCTDWAGAGRWRDNAIFATTLISRWCDQAADGLGMCRSESAVSV